MTERFLLPNKNNLICRNDRIIIGLSGGPDSVYLLYALHEMRETHNLFLTAVHLNHESRPEAVADQEFCRALCEKLAIPFITERISNIKHATTANGSREALWRAARRAFFMRIACEQHANSIALGHHQQDQIETFFIRLIRGSSLTGLTGMKPRSGLYIRPLLTLDKSTILNTLDTHKISYRIDASNDSDQFLRNRIRKTVLPALALCDSRFEQNLANTMQRLCDADTVMQQCAQAYIITSPQSLNNPETQEALGSLIIEQFELAPSGLKHSILNNWLITNKVTYTPSQAFFDEITRFLKMPGNGSHAMHSTWHIKKQDGTAHIKKTCSQTKNATLTICK